MMEIEDLIEKIKQGDNEAFTELYDMTYKKAYVEAMSFMKDEEKAKEALQLAYIQIAKNIHKLQEPKAIYKWINIIVANVCKKQLMKRQEFSFSDYEDNGDDLSIDIEDDYRDYKPDENLKYEDDKAVVLGFINELPTEQRTALVMQIYDGMKISEIADFFDTNENTIKSRLNYAKKTIKQKVEEYKKTGNTLFVIPLMVYLKGIFDSYESSIQISEDVYAHIAVEVESTLQSIPEPQTQTDTIKNKEVIKETSKVRTKGIGKVVTTSAAKYIIAGAVVIGGSVGGYAIYHTTTQNDVTISLLNDDSVSCTFNGYSGSGSIDEADFDYTSIDYDGSNEDITNFLKTIRLSYDDSETLSDGDTVTMTATYSEERAEELNLNIENDTYDVTVELPTLYSSPEDIPDDIVIAVKERIEEYMATSYMGMEALYSYAYTVTYDSYSTWFCYDEENLMNHIMVVYEVTYHYNEGGTKISYWYAYVAQNIASNYFDYEDEVGCYASPIFEAFENGAEMIDDPSLIAEKLPLFWVDTMVFTQFDD